MVQDADLMHSMVPALADFHYEVPVLCKDTQKVSQLAGTMFDGIVEVRAGSLKLMQ